MSHSNTELREILGPPLAFQGVSLSPKLRVWVDQHLVRLNAGMDEWRVDYYMKGVQIMVRKGTRKWYHVLNYPEPTTLLGLGPSRFSWVLILKTERHRYPIHEEKDLGEAYGTPE